MGKASRRKSAPSLKNLDPANPFVLAAPGGVVTEEMLQGIVGAEFIFQNARRTAESLADAAPQPEVKEFFASLADGLRVAERALKPAADMALDGLGLDRDHGLRSDALHLSRGIDPGAVTQHVMGQLVRREAANPTAVLRGSDGSRVAIAPDGVIQHSAPDHVLAEVGLPPSR